MALTVKSFTFVQCSDCHQNIKLEVGKDIEGIVCECKKVEEKAKKRTLRKKVEADAT